MSVSVNSGIDFHNASLSKPGNLQNSAVLRMLEEEEQRQRAGYPPSAKRVAWPPPREGEEYLEQQQPQNQVAYQSNYAAAPQQQPTPNYQRGPQSYQTPPASYKSASNGYQQQQPLSPLTLNQAPSGFSSPTVQGKGWAPVYSPVSTPSQPKFNNPPQQQQQQQYYQQTPPATQYPEQYYQQGAQPTQPVPQYQQTPQYQTPPNTNALYQQAAAPSQAQNQYQPQVTQAFKAPKKVEPPPSTITLRPQAPVSQVPPPVYNSQPATATLKGGKHLRGDLKWPPENVRQRMADEQRQLEELAKGPACRPRKPHKDYSEFFAKHALNSTYPGYKIPPGTQFYMPED